MCVAALSMMHIDTAGLMTAIGAIVIPTLGVLIYGKLTEVSQQTNGQTTRLYALVDGLVEHLKTHQSIPPAPAAPPAETPSQEEPRT